MVYLIGSLSNPQIVDIENTINEAGIETFAQWLCSGPEADQHWKDYGKRRGWSYMETVNSAFVQTAFDFDFKHMQAADACILIMPAGKSAHCEFGWFIGTGRRAYILFDGEPDRPDLMPPNLATGVYFSVEELIEELRKPFTFRACVVCGQKAPDDLVPAAVKEWRSDELITSTNIVRKECDPACGVCHYTCSPDDSCRCPSCV